MDESFLLMRDLKLAYADAMWAWSRVESELFAVYVAAIHGYTANYKSLQESYFAIVSAKSRLDMTNVAAKARWGGTNTAITWTALYSRCSKELRVRGKCAHLKGEVIAPEKPNQKTIAVLTQAFWHPEKHMNYQDAKNRFPNAETLINYAATWNELANDLAKLWSPIWESELDRLSSTSPKQPTHQENVSPQSSPNHAKSPKRRAPSRR